LFFSHTDSNFSLFDHFFYLYRKTLYRFFKLNFSIQYIFSIFRNLLFAEFLQLSMFKVHFISMFYQINNLR